eukprot:8636228-Alexandrium_andersonii.AAC.1
MAWVAKRERKEPGDSLPGTANSTNLGAYIPEADLERFPNAHAKAGALSASCAPRALCDVAAVR